MANGSEKRDRSWLEAQVAEFTDLFPVYQKYANLLQGFLKSTAGDLAPSAIVQTRPKSIVSFAEKAWKKRLKYSDPVHQLTDLCGARVICRTRSEVLAMSEFIEGCLDIDWENSLDCSRRLKPTEFGYRSVHYIVKLRSDMGEILGTDLSDDLIGKAAEIQVRTTVEHAYADFVHDLTYKGAFEFPSSWERELASVASALEEADQTFSRIEDRLSLYASNYGAYLSPEELGTEIENLEVILGFDSANSGKAVRLAKLAQIAGDWEKAEAVLTPFLDPEDTSSSPQPVLRELGVTLCRKTAPRSEEYTRGQEYLELAVREDPEDVDAVSSLAGTWKRLDESRARELYRRAFETDPHNTYAFGNYLEFELPHNPGILPAVQPLLSTAVERCRAQAQAKVNLPWAYFDMGKFYLLLDRPFESFEAYARAISVSTAPYMIETSLSSIQRLEPVAAHLRGFDWVERLLTVGLAARLSPEGREEALQHLQAEDGSPIRGPVLVVAGGTDPRVEDEMQSYADLMVDALSAHGGTVISGGTTQGISGVVGDAAQAYSDRIHTIGYLPEFLPKDATKDTDPSRYSEIRHTDGKGFTPLEPLQNWIDLMGSGIEPEEVRVLGVNGGAIAGAEYQMALALGATVSLLADSGRAASRMLSDPFWADSPGLLALPPDTATLQAFVAWKPMEAPGETDMAVAKAIHEEYRQARLASPASGDPALAPWPELHPDLRTSNLYQAQHIREKLAAIGCTLAAGDEPGEPVREFSPEEIETLACMEHGRWVVERTLAGWKWGETRSPERKLSPHLAPWSELGEEIRELDRHTVRKIPRFLEAAGLRVLRR